MLGADQNRGKTSPAEGDLQSVAYLDQALWNQLEETSSTEVFTSSWLALQCQIISGVARGVVVLKSPESNAYEPVAYWPKGRKATLGLSAAAEAAMAEHRGVARARKAKPGDPEPLSRYCDVAYPFLFDGELVGVVALEIETRPKAQLSSVIRQLQWGAAWIGSLFRRQKSEREAVAYRRTETAFDLTAAVLESGRYRDACSILATELSTCLDCERVSVGFVRRNHTRVESLSHSAHFDKRMNLMRCLGQAMDEAIDQWTIILFPPPEGQVAATRSHAELSRQHGAGVMLTVPLVIKERFVGALTLERGEDHAFEPDEVELVSVLASMIAPILEEKRNNDRLIFTKVVESVRRQLVRLFGPSYLGRKLALAVILAAVAFFSIATGDYRITADTKLEGVVQRAVVAPFAGFIYAANARAGDRVKKGDVLAALDDNDLILERLRWVSDRRRRLLEYDKALAEGERASLNIIKAQIEQADAQIALREEQLARAKVAAPFDGIIVSGDLSQSIGGSIERGELLFKIAPLDAYRILLKVDEREIADVKVGQRGEMVVSSMPESPLPLVVEKITPVSEASEGRNYFLVEASLTEETHIDRLRPGMEGVGKISVDRRNLAWIWSYKTIDWFRLTLWRWWP